MDTNRKPRLILIIGALVALGLIAWWFMGGSDSGISLGEKRGVEGDPIDVTLGFYEPWLSARNATDTDPIAQGLHDSMALSVDMSAKLAEYEGKLGEGELDPVLCQTTLPAGLRTLSVYKQEASAQMLVMSVAKDAGGQAVVTLAADNGLWQITDITCGSSETAPDQGEFNFDKEGLLLKEVPPPLDPQYWHLVFEEGGVFGHTAPLFLDGASMCVSGDGSESVCDANNFEETKAVRVQGDMTEAGVEVKRIEFQN